MTLIDGSGLTRSADGSTTRWMCRGVRRATIIAMDGWTLLVATHAVAATLAVVLGAAQLLRRHHGDRLHRWNGRVWVGLMVFVAVSSFWIRDIRPGRFSWIHVLSVVTIVSLAAALVAIRRHDVVTHAISMSSTYAGMIGALIGVVAVPVRLVPESFQSDWRAMTALALGIAATALIGLALLSVGARRLRPGGRAQGATLDRCGSAGSSSTSCSGTCTPSRRSVPSSDRS